MIATSSQQRLAAATSTGGPLFHGGDQGSVLALTRVPVLIIEDEAMIAWMLESLLEEMGFMIITLASNAIEAVAAVRLRNPELVISDINLGAGPDGIETVGTICGICSPAVIFVSGYIDEDAGKRISALPASARILSKPLRGEQFSAAIRHSLGFGRPN